MPLASHALTALYVGYAWPILLSNATTFVEKFKHGATEQGMEGERSTGKARGPFSRFNRALSD